MLLLLLLLLLIITMMMMMMMMGHECWAGVLGWHWLAQAVMQAGWLAMAGDTGNWPLTCSYLPCPCGPGALHHKATPGGQWHVGMTLNKVAAPCPKWCGMQCPMPLCLAAHLGQSDCTSETGCQQRPQQHKHSPPPPMLHSFTKQREPNMATPSPTGHTHAVPPPNTPRCTSNTPTPLPCHATTPSNTGAPPGLHTHTSPGQRLSTTATPRARASP